MIGSVLYDEHTSWKGDQDRFLKFLSRWEIDLKLLTKFISEEGYKPVFSWTTEDRTTFMKDIKEGKYPKLIEDSLLDIRDCSGSAAKEMYEFKIDNDDGRAS